MIIWCTLYNITNVEHFQHAVQVRYRGWQTVACNWVQWDMLQLLDMSDLLVIWWFWEKTCAMTIDAVSVCIVRSCTCSCLIISFVCLLTLTASLACNYASHTMCWLVPPRMAHVLSGTSTGVDLLSMLFYHLLTVSCFSKIQIGFTFLVPAHLGSPGQNPEGCKTVVVV